MKQSREAWSDLDLKTKLAYITAIVAFAIGWILTIVAFALPPVAIIEESVLWVLGQSLLYAGGVLGVGLYVTHSTRSMKRSIGHYMAEEFSKMRNGEEVEADEDETQEA